MKEYPKAICQNEYCNLEFRYWGTIKPKLCPRCQNLKNFEKSKQKIENNKKLLAQSTLYSKNNRSVLEPIKRTTLKKGVKKQPKIGLKQKIEKQLDEAWSKLVKLKAGNKCEVCGKTTNLNSHHIYSRAKKSLRWNTINGICLCVGHHIGVQFSAHKTPIEFIDWLKDKKGEDKMQELRIMANITSKYSVLEKELLLKELQKEIKKYK